MNRMPDPRANVPGPGVPPPRQPGPHGPASPQYGPPPGWAGPPQGPPPGMPQQPKGSKRAAVIIVAAVALVAAAGGFWFFTRDGGSDTGGDEDYNAAVEELGAAEVSWQVSHTDLPSTFRADDYWVTDEHLVRRLPGRVVAYDLESGDEAWEFALDGPKEDECSSSREVSNNRVALLRRTGGDGDVCAKLTVLDISTGKEVLTTEFPTPEAPSKDKGLDETPPAPIRADTPVMFGERVVVPGEHVRVVDLASGAEVQTPVSGGGCAMRLSGVFADVMLADMLCGKSERTGVLRAFDANFNLLWEWKLPENETGDPLPVLGVLSVDPLVVEVGFSGHQPKLMRVDPTSGDAVQLSDYGDERGTYSLACNGFGLGNCLQAKVVDNKLVLMTAVESVSPGSEDAASGAQSTDHRNELVAFDLDSGEEAWRTGVKAGQVLSVVPTPDAELVAFQAANLNGGKAILHSVDPGTGKLEPLVPIGPKAHENDKLSMYVTAYGFGGDNSRAVWRDGVFVLFASVLRDEDEGEPETVAFALSN
jgi:outer membrane protein assembly factor BamB